MVEIKHPDAMSPSDSVVEDAKHRLLYSKSKVYVHPTAYARDNIPGFVALVKRVRVAHILAYSFSILSFRKLSILHIYLRGYLRIY